MLIAFGLFLVRWPTDLEAFRPVARRYASGSVPIGVGLGGLVLEVPEQSAQFAADEVTGRDLAEAEAQAGDLAGQELHVGVRLGVGVAVLLLGDAVATFLPVLGQQDQRRGV